MRALNEAAAALTAATAGRQTTTVVLGAGSNDLDAGRRFLAAAGQWVVPDWPASLGGGGVDEATAARIADLRARLPLPDLYPFHVGLFVVGPIILEVGAPQQQAEWLPAIASGHEIWCQMFSEPGAGSDLANVATAALAEGPDWRLNGQKVWTSRGMYADWGICLARTDPQVPKHQGLTMFAIRMDQPGVEVRPLRQMNGDTHFTEVFLDGAAVPDAQRIGPLGYGWQLAVRMLATERASLAGRPAAGAMDASGEARLIDLIRSGDGQTRDRALRALINGRIDRLAGSTATPPTGKLRTVASYKERAYLETAARRTEGMLAEPALPCVTAPSMSIRGGTDEIQKNLTADRTLGLPPEPRVDKGDSYEDLRRSGRA